MWEATKALQDVLPTANILMFTVSDKQADLFAAMRAGAKGYVLKNATGSDLTRAVFQIAQGGVIISPEMATKLLGELKVESDPSNQDGLAAALTPLEAEVLALVSKGASNKELASALFVSENTIKTHMRNIMDKLHLANRSQAAAYGARDESWPIRVVAEKGQLPSRALASQQYGQLLLWSAARRSTGNMAP